MTTVAPVYPPVHKMSVDFEWMSLVDIFANFESGDLNDWSESSLDIKREDFYYEELLESIREEGFYDPIYLNERNFVNNGHHRIAVCIDLGYTHIPFTRDVEIGFENSSGVGTL